MVKQCQAFCPSRTAVSHPEFEDLDSEVAHVAVGKVFPEQKHVEDQRVAFFCCVTLYSLLN